MSDEGNTPGRPLQTTPVKTIVVSMDRFSTIPRRRRRYAVMYLAMMAMWVTTTFVGIRTQARVEEAATHEIIVEEETSGNETAGASDREDAASSVEGDFTETTKSLLEQRPIIYLQAATGACMALFYLNFIGVLRTMGYPAIMILGICLACFFPLPGLLVVAAIDRRVSKAWHAALPDPD